jgi:predicted AAA+ superfamily ATPase
MLNRHFHRLLARKLSYFPAVAILGPRQVGKTTFAKQVADSGLKESIYLDLESRADIAKLSSDPEAFLESHSDKLVIIDEAQQMPEIFTILRPVIDKNRVAGRFLLLGSASPSLVRGVSESLAGRISYLDLPPLMLSEILPQYNMNVHWFRGGFPNAFLAPDNHLFADWAESFTRSYVERDFNHLFGTNLNPTLMGRLWQMIAYNQSHIWNGEEYARSLGVTTPVINRYVEILEGAFLVRRLLPWYSNNGKRLVKAPKIYLRDTGVLHYWNRISNFEDLQGHPIVGASWESYVIEQIILQKNPDIDAYFYRTHSGAELDLVLVQGNKPLIGIEIKYTNAPSVSKGFYQSIEDLQTEKNFVITPNSDTYPVKMATVCALSHFILKELGKIGDNKLDENIPEITS